MIGLALRLAGRELRSGLLHERLRGMRIVLACLALGVAAIAAIGSLRQGVEAGLSGQTRALLGGDLALGGGSEPFPDALRALLRARGDRVSDLVQMHAMLYAADGRRALVALKAVDGAYPLAGAVSLVPPGKLAPALAVGKGGLPGIVVEPVLLDRLHLAPGAVVRLGGEKFRLRAGLRTAPDSLASSGLLAPLAIAPLAALPATGLVQPGSLLSHDLRIDLGPGQTVAGTRAALARAFPGASWRVRGPADAVPGLGRLIGRMAEFLTLVGLTALLVGGIGIATGVRAWLQSRARSLAVLRCLGASSRLVFATMLIQVLALALIGILAGLVLGALLPPVGVAILGRALPIPPRLGLFPGPLALAASYGLLTASLFSLPALARAAAIPGAALFRDASLPARLPRAPWVLAAVTVLGAALVALAALTAPQPALALWFAAGAAFTLLVYRAGGALLVAAARRAPRFGPAVRLGLANLHRPGSQAPVMLVAIGLGLTTLAAVALVEGNLRQEVLRALPEGAPSLYFIDIQPDELARFDAIAHAAPGVTAVEQVPALRARIVAVDGVPAASVRASPQTRWALRGDRGLTYSATPPPGTRLAAGRWWAADYAGPPLVSLDAGLAAGWGTHVGGRVTVEVLGRDVELRIASLRTIAWQRLGLNFALVASPGLLSAAPHSVIAAVHTRMEGGGSRDDATLLNAVTDALPNVTGIRVADILAAVAGLVGRIAAALSATGSLALASGALVLAGSIAAGQRRRTAESVILKSLGATRGQIRAAWMVEFGAIGLVAGLLAALVGTAASWAVMRFVLHAPWRFLPGILALTLLACVALMLGLGFVGTGAALRARAAPLLRNE